MNVSFDDVNLILEEGDEISSDYRFCELVLRFFFFLFLSLSLFFFFGLSYAPLAFGSSQVRGRIRAKFVGLYPSSGNAMSGPHLRPTLQLTATPDPLPTERGQGSNLHPHVY